MRLRSRVAVGVIGAIAALGCGSTISSAGTARAGSAPNAGEQQRTTQSTQLPAAGRQGWWIRVNGSTEAQYVHLRFGGDPKRLSAPITRARLDNEFDLPAAERALESVEIAALAMPPAAKASLCVFYKDQAVRLVEFNQQQNVRVSQNERTEECRP